MKRDCIKPSNIIIPVYLPRFGRKTEILLYIHYLRQNNIISKQIAQGYKSCLKSSANDYDIYRALEDRYGQSPSFVYVNYSDFLKYMVDEDIFHRIIPLSELFEHYAEMRPIELWKDFFKYIPQLKPYIPRSDEDIFDIGYCCEDCDGSLSRYKEYNKSYAIRRIKHDLDNINIKIPLDFYTKK